MKTRASNWTCGLGIFQHVALVNPRCQWTTWQHSTSSKTRALCPATPRLLLSTLPCHVQIYIGFVRSTILSLVSGKCVCLSFVPSLRELGYTQFTWEIILRIRRKEWCEGTEVYCQGDFWAKVGKLAVPQGILGKHTDYPRTAHQKAEDWRTCLLLLSLGDDMVVALILPFIDRPCPVCKFLCLYEGSGEKQDKTKGRKLLSFAM